MHIWQSLKLSPHNESQKRHKHENDSKNITKRIFNFNYDKFCSKRFLNTIS